MQIKAITLRITEKLNKKQVINVTECQDVSENELIDALASYLLLSVQKPITLG